MRWLAGGAVLLLLPKCLVCVAGYVALVTGLAVASPELCGAVEKAGAADVVAVAGGLILAGAGWTVLKGRRRLSGTRRVDR